MNSLRVNGQFYQWLGVLLLTGALAACGAEVEADGSDIDAALNDGAEALAAATCNVTWQRELLVTDPKVINNPNFIAAGKPWHFGTLMTQMAPAGVKPSTMVKNWLTSFTNRITLNGRFVAARPGMTDFIQAWPVVGAAKELDLRRAPFRLLAIVYRPDLASANKAGEGRFVFQALGKEGNILPFTVIFEFNLIGNAKLWATEFHKLGALAPSDPRFAVRLETITRRFTKSQPPAAVLRGSLSQLRTNEIAFSAPWELREFRLRTTGLTPAPVAATPFAAWNGTPALARAIKLHKGAVPMKFENHSFRGGSAFTILGGSDLWTAPGISKATMDRFSINTCGGCHGGATNTTFLHIESSFDKKTTVLSNFIISADRKSGDVITRAGLLKNILCPVPTPAGSNNRTGEDELVNLERVH